MTEKEARQQDLFYTGMSFASYDYKSAEYYKNKVAEYRATYGNNIRLVKVKDNNGWYTYYGDANFCKLNHNNIDYMNRYVGEYDKRVAELKKKYDDELAELNVQQKKAVEFLEFEKSIRKK